MGAMAHLVMSSCRREVNCEGKKPGKYFWRKLKMRTWPTGVSGAIRMMAKGMKVRRSLAVRRSACTCDDRRDQRASIQCKTCKIAGS